MASAHHSGQFSLSSDYATGPFTPSPTSSPKERREDNLTLGCPQEKDTQSSATPLQSDKTSFLGPEGTLFKPLPLSVLRSAPSLATQPMYISSRRRSWVSPVRMDDFPPAPRHLHVTCYSPFFPSLNIDGLELDPAQEGASQALPSRDLGSTRGATWHKNLQHHMEGWCWERAPATPGSPGALWSKWGDWVCQVSGGGLQARSTAILRGGGETEGLP